MNQTTAGYRIKFFYDYFTDDQVPGMFGFEHFMYLIVFFSVLSILIKRSRNLTAESQDRIVRWVTLCITIAEVVKFAISVYKGASPDNYIPLYFCGLFLFSLWLSVSNIPVLRNTGYAYITMGGIMAGIIFTFYPSTSLLLYPLWHPNTIYAALYHGAMIYIGVVTLMRRKYEPTPHHAKYYFIFISAACVVSIVINKYLGTNCMFMRDPFGMPLLTEIERWCRPAYMLLAWFGQSVVLYWFNYFVYKTLRNRAEKKLSDGADENDECEAEETDTVTK